MKRFIVTEFQLKEFIKLKKAEKIFYNILEQIHRNEKFLNENISHKNANQSIIDDYKNKNIITPEVHELLMKHNILDDNYQII